MDDKLTVQQLEEVLVWVDKFDLSKPSKYLNRDFSDGGNLNNMLNSCMKS